MIEKMKIRLPKKENLRATGPTDPALLKFGYYSRFNYPMVARLKMVLDLVPEEPFENLLEVGYGSGIMIPELTARLVPEGVYYGIDTHTSPHLVREMIEEEGISARIELDTGDVRHLPYPDRKMDIVIAVSILEHLDTGALEEAFGEMRRVLKNGGNLILGFPTKHFLIKALSVVNKWDFDKEHPSSDKDILRLGKKFFAVEEMLKFPPLYIAVRMKKDRV